ncbi:type II secretion system F family protein [Skermania sp. ID1734]|uniref:type II secretion system F family protein n=1 Tax=Skermania sp. ID1734 TaxID=2597516 RepID=UPI00351AED2B
MPRRDAGACGVIACAALALWQGTWTAAALAAVLLTARLRLRRMRQDRIQARARRELSDGIEIIVAELRVGAHPAVACSTAAAECSGQTAQVLAAAGARSKLGGHGADALVQNPHGPVNTELSAIANAWRLAETHGLALADLLDAARADLSARVRFRSRVESGLAGARATATVLAGLPALGVALGQLMGAAPLAVLFGGGIGAVLLFAGTALACIGLLWTDQLIKRVVQ